MVLSWSDMDTVSRELQAPIHNVTDYYQISVGENINTSNQLSSSVRPAVTQLWFIVIGKVS